MLSRRHFLGTLLASIAGSAFVPNQLLWTPSPELGLPLVAPQALLTLDDITREAAIRLAKRVQLPVTMAREGLRLGDQGMRNQLGIDLALPDRLGELGLNPTFYIEPMVAALAHAIYREGWEAFGELALPMACDSSRYTVDGVSVRGVQIYDPERDSSFLRLDVIGGDRA